MNVWWIGFGYEKLTNAESKLKLVCCFSFSFNPYKNASLVAQTVKSLPAVQETRVWFLGWEDSLEKEMTTPSSILAWKIPWTKEPGRLQSMGLQRVGHNWVTSHIKKYDKIRYNKKNENKK